MYRVIIRIGIHFCIGAILLVCTGCSQEAKTNRLIRELEKKSRNDRDVAHIVDSIAAIGEPAIVPIINSFPKFAKFTKEGHTIRTVIVKPLIQIGAPAVDKLVPVTRDTDPGIRYLAAAALGGIRDRKGLEPLLSMLSNPTEDCHVLVQVIRSLGAMGNKAAYSPLIDILRARNDCKGLIDNLLETTLEALADIRDGHKIPERNFFRYIESDEQQIRDLRTEVLDVLIKNNPKNIQRFNYKERKNWIKSFNFDPRKLIILDCMKGHEKSYYVYGMIEWLRPYVGESFAVFAVLDDKSWDVGVYREIGSENIVGMARAGVATVAIIYWPESIIFAVVDNVPWSAPSFFRQNYVGNRFVKSESSGGLSLVQSLTELAITSWTGRGEL